jgi:hypothetical protein
MNPNKYLFLLLSLCCLLQKQMQDKKSYPKTNLEQFDCHSGKYRLAKSGTDPIEKKKRIILKF